MKIVLDANVVVAAFASRGLCESIMELCPHMHEILLCEELLDEILRNLRRKVKLPSRIVDDIGNLLKDYATMIRPVPLPVGARRDPDDVKIFGLAVAADADCIVTGDKDLLVLQSFRGVPVLTPKAFSEILHGKQNRF